MPDEVEVSDLWDRYKVNITLKEPLLGTIPKNKDIYADHVRDKVRAQEDEVPPESFSELEEKGWTSFYTVSDTDLRPVIMDYQFKGFLKEAGNVLKDILGVKALRSHVESTVFVFPRKTVLADIPDGVIERPLRAMTMQGPRVSLTRSDYINAGRSYEFELRVLKGSKVTEKVLRGIMEYGQVRGLLQWRNGGYGSFDSTIEKLTQLPGEDYLVECHGCGLTWWLDYEPSRCTCLHDDVHDMPSSTIHFGTYPGTHGTEHHYVSTACRHDLHTRCRESCKFCYQDCICKCHREAIAK